MEKQTEAQDSVQARFVRYTYVAFLYKKADFEQKWVSRQSMETGLEECRGSRTLKEAMAVSDAYLPEQFENEQLYQAFFRLKPKERQVLVMRCIQDLPFQQIANKLNMSYKGVAAIYYRSVQKMRKLMKAAQK